MSKEKSEEKSKNKETKEQKNLKLEIIQSFSALIASGFGLVAALAWNEAIQDLFRKIAPEQSGLIWKFGYAVLITILIVTTTYYLGSLANRIKSKIKD